MANVKAIKDTGFLGSRKAIGTLRFMKAIETPKVESKTDKNNKSKVAFQIFLFRWMDVKKFQSIIKRNKKYKSKV